MRPKRQAASPCTRFYLSHHRRFVQRVGTLDPSLLGLGLPNVDTRGLNYSPVEALRGEALTCKVYDICKGQIIGTDRQALARFSLRERILACDGSISNEERAIPHKRLFGPSRSVIDVLQKEFGCRPVSLPKHGHCPGAPGQNLVVRCAW